MTSSCVNWTLTTKATMAGDLLNVRNVAVGLLAVAAPGVADTIQGWDNARLVGLAARNRRRRPAVPHSFRN